MNVRTIGVLGRLVSLALAALAAGILVWLLNSARIEAIAGSALGQNVFRLDTNELRERLREFPGVADALVEVAIDGRVSVTVSYQAPVANWVVGEQSYLVNADGEVLAARYQPDLQLTVEDSSSRGVAVGDRINAEALRAAHQLQNNLPFLRVVPSRIQYSAGGLMVVDHAGRELQFGSIDRLAAKLIALQAVLEEASRRGERIASVDLRPVDRPTYRTVDAPPLLSTLDVPP